MASFVGEYERAYLHNSVLQEDTESVGTPVSIHSTEEVSGGFVVAVDSVYYANVQSVTTDGETATVLHTDGPETRKAYLVTASDSSGRRGVRAGSRPEGGRRDGGVLGRRLSGGRTPVTC